MKRAVRMTAEARRQAIRVARLDPTRDQLYCYYSGVELVEEHGHPAYPCLEHKIPGNPNEGALAAWIVNQMKAGFTEVDFKVLVIELAKRFQQQPYDMELVRQIVYRGKGGRRAE